jgi:PAS domain S-box-containing protein
LQKIPGFVDSRGKEELGQMLQNDVELWREKEERIHDFKSENAILTNSLAYFPIAIEDLVAKNSTSKVLAEECNSLLRNILLFNLSTDPALGNQIKGQIRHILSTNQGEDFKDVEIAIAHARKILRNHVRVNELVKAIVSSKTTKHSANLSRTYETYYQQALNETSTYRLLFYLLSIVWLVSIASWIILRIKAYATATKKAEAKYRSIFENSVAGIFQTTPDGRYLSANPRLAEILGYESVEGLMELTDLEQLYVLPERREEFINSIESKGAITDFESQFYRQDGKPVWISTNVRRVCDKKGKLLYYEGTATDITARKQAEIALQDSEAELKLLFAAMNDTVIVFDREGHYLKYIQNKSFIYKPTVKRLGKTVREILPKEVAELFMRAIEHALNSYQESKNLAEILQDCTPKYDTICVEYCLPIKGKKVWFNANVSALDENTVLWVGRDISDRKQIEEALRRSESKFRNLFENSLAGIYCSRFRDGLVVEANQRFVELMGYDSVDEIVGVKHNYDFCASPETRQQMNEKLHQHGQVNNFEIKFKRKDGFIGWGLYSARLNLEEDSLISVITNISDRKRAEESLQRSEERFRQLAENIRAVFWMSDPEQNRMIYVSPAYRTIWDRSPQSLLEEPNSWTDAIIPEDRARILASLPKQIRGEYDQEYRIVRPDGELRWIHDRAFPVYDELGQVYRIAGIAEDISDRKHKEELLRQAEASLKVAKEAANDFELDSLLSWLKQMFKLKAESKGLQLNFNLASNLPQYIRTDESKLRQVLVNLLSNGIKFTSKGSVTLRVRMQGTENIRRGEWPFAPTPHTLIPPHPTLHTLIFEIEDTGAGIAKSELENLFKPFVQTESGIQSQEGTGLGLPISQKFIQLMGGDITVNSKLGEGTLFQFDIQTSSVEAIELQVKESSQQVIGLEAGQPDYRILIVEDKLESRRLMVELLSSVGFQVNEASNGREAIELYQSWSPHLIWMDIRMPIMNGYEATLVVALSFISYQLSAMNHEL